MRLVENERNVFLSPAWNQAARLTAAPWLLFLNPDTELREGTLAKVCFARGSMSASDKAEARKYALQGSLFNNWEQPFVAWAERNGIALEYAANSDLELYPGLLAAYRLVLSVGHDEYWSAPMRDNLEQFIGAGGNVAFFSGNTCCWQVRSEDGGMALTSWKQNFGQDPRSEEHTSELQSH